jgi:hypothetical protein
VTGEGPQRAQLFAELEPDPEAGEGSSFELQLALINAHAEEGDVAGVRAQLPGFLEKYADSHDNAVSHAYVALLKALRCVPDDTSAFGGASACTNGSHAQHCAQEDAGRARRAGLRGRSAGSGGGGARARGGRSRQGARHAHVPDPHQRPVRAAEERVRGVFGTP